MSRRYPLELLRQVRASEKEARAREHREKMRETEARAAEARSAATGRAEAEGAFRATRDGEQALLSAGELTVRDLARGDAWRAAEDGRIAEKRTTERRAAEALRASTAAENRSRDAVVAARANEEVVVRHQARFERAERRAVEGRAEREAEDAARARRPRGAS